MSEPYQDGPLIRYLRRHGYSEDTILRVDQITRDSMQFIGLLLLLGTLVLLLVAWDGSVR